MGVITDAFGEGLDDSVNQAVQTAIAKLKELGATIQEITCPRFRSGIAAYYVIAPSEASANLARYDAVKYGIREDAGNLMETYTHTKGFGAEVKRRIMLGTYALSAGYYDRRH